MVNKICRQQPIERGFILGTILVATVAAVWMSRCRVGSSSFIVMGSVGGANLALFTALIINQVLKKPKGCLSEEGKIKRRMDLDPCRELPKEQFGKDFHRTCAVFIQGELDVAKTFNEKLQGSGKPPLTPDLIEAMQEMERRPMKLSRLLDKIIAGQSPEHAQKWVDHFGQESLEEIRLLYEAARLEVFESKLKDLFPNEEEQVLLKNLTTQDPMNWVYREIFRQFPDLNFNVEEAHRIYNVVKTGEDWKVEILASSAHGMERTPYFEFKITIFPGGDTLIEWKKMQSFERTFSWEIVQ